LFQFGMAIWCVCVKYTHYTACTLLKLITIKIKI
jgi:hypothetical protein